MMKKQASMILTVDGKGTGQGTIGDFKVRASVL